MRPGFTCRSLGAAFCLALVAVGVVLAEQPYASYPAAARTLYEQGEAWRKEGRFRDAAAAYDQAIQLGMQDYPRAHLHRAESYRQLNEHRRAVTLYTRFVEEFGLERSCRHRLLTAYRGRAAAYQALGEETRAKADYDMVVLLGEFALSLREEGNVAERQEALEEAAEAHRRRATFLKERGRLQEALADQIRSSRLAEKARGGWAVDQEVSPPTARQSKQAARGTVRFVNAWHSMVTIELDGQRYPLTPGQEETITRHTGPFTYRVLGVGEPTTRDLPAGWTHTIRIQPTQSP